MPVSAADVTRAMLANINSIREGLVFDVTQDSLHNETSERNLFGKGHDHRSILEPIGYSRATPDPKHHGQSTRSPIYTHRTDQKPRS